MSIYNYVFMNKRYWTKISYENNLGFAQSDRLSTLEKKSSKHNIWIRLLPPRGIINAFIPGLDN